MKTKINFSIFDEFPKLETDRLILREMKKSDAEYLYDIRSNEKVMELMDTSSLKSIKEAEEMVQRISTAFAEKKQINWAISLKEKPEMIGYVCFWKITPEHCRAEIGYAMKPAYWRKGIMAEALKEVAVFAFQKMDLHSIEANVNEKNIGSIKTLEKIGFKKEAHFRENYLYDGIFLDSIIYSLLEKDLF